VLVLEDVHDYEYEYARPLGTAADTGADTGTDADTGTGAGTDADTGAGAGGGTDVCSTAASALIENCDPNVQDDVNSVSNSLMNACGITDFSASDLNSQSALESLCVDALAGTEVSEAEAAAFKAVLNTKVGCMSVANNIGLACRDFL